MNHRLKNYICLLFLAAAPYFTSCMQWNGDVGDWFGSWYLESMMINGEPDEQYISNQENHTKEIMISFQGKVFNIGYLNSLEIYGSWSYAGEILTLIAGYNTGSGSSRPDYFNPFPVVMHFPEDVDQLEITVTYINSRTMQWQYIDQNGDLITYNFRKYP